MRSSRAEVLLPVTPEKFASGSSLSVTQTSVTVVSDGMSTVLLLNWLTSSVFPKNALARTVPPAQLFEPCLNVIDIIAPSLTAAVTVALPPSLLIPRTGALHVQFSLLPFAQYNRVTAGVYATVHSGGGTIRRGDLVRLEG